MKMALCNVFSEACISVCRQHQQMLGMFIESENLASWYGLHILRKELQKKLVSSNSVYSNFYSSFKLTPQSQHSPVCGAKLPRIRSVHIDNR